MIEPKVFFRKLDHVLTRITKDKADGHFLYSIVTELEKIFGDELHITNGRIYEQEEGQYILVDPPVNSNGSNPAKNLIIDSEAVKYVLNHGAYIYDDPHISIDKGISKQNEYTIPAAIAVKSFEQRWIFVFELKSGWAREEVEFTLNAVRTMLEYRLMSEAVQSELFRAAQIQQSLLPASAPEMKGYDIYGRSQPAELVGGDFFDYLAFDGEILGIAVGDASGHGLPAALLVRDVDTGLRIGIEKEMKMVYTLKKLNKVIHRSTYSSGFASLFYGELESNGNFIYVNAGHPAPILMTENRESQLLDANGLIIGAIPEIQLSRSYTKIEQGAILVCYSDGIFERENAQGEQFGLQRLQKLIQRNKRKSAKEIVTAIFENVYAYGNSQKWLDDATVVVVKRLKNKK
ncbi:MAG: PP2C family protein-serine/threonine phosphatase [bacterium]